MDGDIGKLQYSFDDLRDDLYWGGILNENLPPTIDYTKWECFGFKDGGEPVFAWALHSYVGLGNARYQYYEAEISLVALDPKWASKKRMRVVLASFFSRTSYNRLTALIRFDNRQAVKLAQLVGFTLEGIIRRPAAELDILQLSLLREEWLAGKFNECIR